MPEEESVFVINGFYAAMRAKYTAPGSSIYYFSVEWDAAALSWADFRSEVLGATDPESAAPGSMRNEVFQRWESLGLASKPNVGDNGVHGSASPFEGVAERLNWLGMTLDDDSTGHALLEAGVKRDTLLQWTKDPKVDIDGTPSSLFDAFEDLDVPQALKLAQKLGGDPFEDTPKFATNQAFMFIKPHANNIATRALVKTALRERNIAVVDEGEIDAVTILSRKLIDTHYYAIANKASLSKPVELSPPEKTLAEFTTKFGLTWQQALADGSVYNAVDACDVLGIDAESMDAQWAVAKASHELLKFGGGFYVARMPKKMPTAVVPSAGDILSDMPKSLYGGLDALALPNGNIDDSEKMLLFPESVIKAAVDTLKEVAIDDFKSEQYERAVKHLTVALSLDEKSHVLYSNRCTAYIALELYDKAMEDADECVRLQPSWAKGYLRRGSVYFRMGQLEKSEVVLKEGLELDPGNDALKKELEAVMNAIAERMARQRESLEAKEKAIEAFNEQNYKGAVDLLKKAIKLDPDNHIFYSNRAAAYMALEQYEKALGDADECIRLQPTWAKGYSRRAAAKFHLGDLQAAKLSYSKAWDLEPSNAKTKADLEHVLSEIAGMKVVLPERGS